MTRALRCFPRFGITLVAGVLFTAVRFKLTIEADGIICRGRFVVVEVRRHTGATLRRGRDKPTRFMGPPPFYELSLRTAQKSLVISSLPLGLDAFSSVVDAVAERIEIEVDVASEDLLSEFDSSMKQS